MKGLFKLFSAAAVVGSLASCSEDLSLNQANIDPNADLVATLPSSVTTRVAVTENFEYVWNEDDIINLYSKNVGSYGVYSLTSGAGTKTGNFVHSQGQDMKGIADLYAVTESPNLYGVSVTADGKQKLTADIPFTLNQEKEELAYWPLQVPFWGTATISGGQLNTNLKALTAMLKIDVAALPAGTSAIVLTTHHDAKLSDGTTDVELGGGDEPLTGRFYAILQDDAKMEVDNMMINADTLRIEIDPTTIGDQDRIVYVPIVPQYYEKLTVLALQGDNADKYSWPLNSTVLKVYEDVDFAAGEARVIAQTAPIEIGSLGVAMTVDEASKAIAELMINNQGHTINAVVLSDVTGAGEQLYLPNNDELRTSVNITFKGQNEEFDIVEAAANYNPSMAAGYLTLSTSAPWIVDPTFVAPYAGIVSKNKVRTVRLNFPADEPSHNIILPTSNVEIDAEGLGFASGSEVKILASNTKEVSGYTDEDSWNTPTNYRNAGIVLKGGTQGTYIIHGGQLGDVYTFGNGVDDEINELDFEGIMTAPANINLRITDMLVNTIDYVSLGANAESTIFTTGNAAIKQILERHTGHTNTVKVSASWTGKQLSEWALSQGYDQETIYTAAQLQGMGLNTHTNGGGSPAAYEMADRVRSVWLGGSLFPWIGADVTLPDGSAISDSFTFDGKNCNLRNMTLDLFEPYVPLECCCDVPQRVKLTENIGLIRRVVTTSTVDIKNVDLSDVLINTRNLKINNIGAICGLIDADDAVTLKDNAVASVRVDGKGSNIGGAFGWIDSNSNVTIEGSSKLHGLIVDEASTIYGKSWVESAGQNIGGAIGLIAHYDDTDDALTYVPQVSASDIYVKAQYVKSKDDNVGGQVGLVKAAVLNYGKSGAGNVGNMYVEMNDQIYTIGSNVGGLIGQADYKDDEPAMIKGTVRVMNQIEADLNSKSVGLNGVNESGSNVGGLVGLDIIADALDARTNVTKIDGDVEAGTILAQNRNAGGFVGYYEANKLTTNDVKVANKVTVKKLLEATEGYVGGLYGYIRTSEVTTIGTNVDGKDIAVDITKIAGSKAVGGLVGSNTDNAGVKVNTVSTSTADYSIKITIKDWANTKIAADFATVADRKFCGSFGTVIGFMNKKVEITDNNLTVAAQAGILKVYTRNDNTYGLPDFTSKNPIFTDSKKKDLLFDIQKVSQATIGTQTITGQGFYFWGDENGYVGVNNNSSNNSYILDGTPLRGNVNYNLYSDYQTVVNN